MKIQKWSYGEYASSNYGAHTQAVRIGSLTLYFSYDTIVAFHAPFTPALVSLAGHGIFNGTVCCENVWSTTTGKHLNWIEKDKKARVDSETFQSALTDLLKKHKLDIS